MPLTLRAPLDQGMVMTNATTSQLTTSDLPRQRSVPAEASASGPPVPAGLSVTRRDAAVLTLVVAVLAAMVGLIAASEPAPRVRVPSTNSHWSQLLTGPLGGQPQAPAPPRGPSWIQQFLLHGSR